MDNFQLMQVVDTIDYLVEKATGFTLSQSFISKILLFLVCNVVEKLPARAVLHDQKQVLGSLNDFVKLNQIGMADEL